MRKGPLITAIVARAGHHCAVAEPGDYISVQTQVPGHHAIVDGTTVLDAREGRGANQRATYDIIVVGPAVPVHTIIKIIISSPQDQAVYIMKRSALVPGVEEFQIDIAEEGFLVFIPQVQPPQAVSNVLHPFTRAIFKDGLPGGRQAKLLMPVADPELLCAQVVAINV